MAKVKDAAFRITEEFPKGLASKCLWADASRFLDQQIQFLGELATAGILGSLAGCRRDRSRWSPQFSRRRRCPCLDLEVQNRGSRFVLATRMNNLAYPGSIESEAQIVLGPMIVVSLTDTNPFPNGLDPPIRLTRGIIEPPQTNQPSRLLACVPRVRQDRPESTKRQAQEHQETAPDYIVISHTLRRILCSTSLGIPHMIDLLEMFPDVLFGRTPRNKIMDSVALGIAP